MTSRGIVGRSMRHRRRERVQSVLARSLPGVSFGAAIVSGLFISPASYRVRSVSTRQKQALECLRVVATVPNPSGWKRVYTRRTRVTVSAGVCYETACDCERIEHEQQRRYPSELESVRAGYNVSPGLECFEMRKCAEPVTGLGNACSTRKAAAQPLSPVCYMNMITITFDGGCRPTNPGNKYGSYEVKLNGKQAALVSRLELGFGTNNEAEFQILEAALAWTANMIVVAGNSMADFDLEVISDSTIVVNRLLGRNTTRKSEPQQRMAKHTANCLSYAIMYKSFKAKWRGREANVMLFGH